MNININRMGIFNKIAGNGDDIVNLKRIGESDAFTQSTNGKYRWYNPFRAIRRQATVDANRLARETLLKNLRSAFGLEDDDGYMDELKRRIGDDVLKSGDFDVGPDGKVRTSCPLTARRVTAIMTRVKELAANERASAPKAVENVTDEVVQQRIRFLQQEVGEPFYAFLQSKRDVQIVKQDGVKTVENVGFYADTNNSRALMVSVKQRIDIEINGMAKVGVSGWKLTRASNALFHLKDAAGLVVDPFVYSTVLVDGRKMKGCDYFSQLVNEKLEELISAFNRSHPELSVG